MKPNTVIRILFALDEVDEAEQIISLLRNAGIAVRPTRASDPDELQKMLDKAPDLVLIDLSSKNLTLEDVHKQVTASGKDIASLALARSADDHLLARTAELGVHGLLLLSHPNQLTAVVEREFDSLAMRRNVRRLRAALSESERRCDSLLESSNDAIAYVHEGMHVRANKAYLELFGMQSFEDVEGMTLLDMIAPQDAGDFKQLLSRISKGENPPERLEARARRQDDEEFDAILHFAHATYEDEPCVQIIFRQDEPDTSELQWRDNVTGLFNRSHMMQAIDKAAAAAAQGRTDQALLFIEPDNFRATMDSVGMSATDNVLHSLSSVLAEQLGDRDVAGRIADKTFAVLLLGYPQDKAIALTETLRKAVEGAILDAGAKSISVTVSIGGSLLGEKNASTRDLLDQANEQLRSAQEQGGNRVEVFNPAARDQEEAEREQRWVAAIKNALVKDEFVLFHQQVVSLQGAEEELYEVLLRLRGSNGEILPNAFLPAAERNKLMPAIDRWVIKHALELLARRIRDGQPTSYLIKLSIQSLADQKLAAWIALQLKEHKVPASSLILEMPESKVLTAIKPAAAFVAAIRKLGCNFALEQFGTGLKSFQLLQHIDANYLKIDRNFLDDLPNNEESQEKIREICEHARKGNRQTIAEWVQDAASTALLFNAGVDFVQGNFLQEPEEIIQHETVV